MTGTHAAEGITQTTQGNNQQILDAINTIGLAHGFDPQNPENTLLKNQNDLEIKVEEFKSEHVNTVKELKEALHGAITSTAGNHINTVTELKDTINSAIVNSADNHTNTIADLKDSLKTVISEQSSTHTSTVNDLKDTINNTLSISNTNNTALLNNLTSTIEQAIVQSLTGISNAFSEKFGELANSISNRDASANNRIENLISSLTQDSNSSSDSLNKFAESIIKRDSSANERIENLITTLTVIDSCGNQELNNLAKTIISKDSSANDRLENLTKQLLQNDISSNNRLQELVTTLTNIDISFNNRLFELTQTIVNRDLSANQRFETLINKINDTDSSQNQRIINLISTINKNDISRNDHLSNLIIQIKNNDASFNENTRQIITSIQNSDISSSAITNKLINTFISRDASNTELLVSTLSNINTRADHRNGLLIDKISNFDISLNKNLENIIENIAISDSCSNYIFQNMTQQLINSDSSANERIHKLCSSIHNFDISFSEAINDTLIAIDNSRNETLQRIKHMDNSTNQHIVNLISSIDQSNNVIIEKMQDILCTIHHSHDETMDNICDVMNNLNIQSNETQQKLQEYIGRYIVIPLFKQRIIDTSVTYYKMLEKRILCVIEEYLNYFKDGDFSSLTVYFNNAKQIELINEIYDIKKEAFEKFLTFTPGATCFSDMDEDTVEQYKSFRKYISWAYKTLDGLIKSMGVWGSLIQLDIYKIDSDILNDTELLTDYLQAVANERTNNLSELNTSAVLNVTGIRFKPEYEEYKKRYGWPEDGLFDSEKLAGIIKDLQASGIIDENKKEQIFSSGTSTEDNTECTSNTETGETSNTETGETSNTEQETTENDTATSSSETQYSSAETQESSAETQESSAETQESSAETQESSDCGEKSSSEKSSSEKSSSEKSSSEKSSSDCNNDSANSDSGSCKSKSDSSNKSSDTDVNSIVKSLSSCSTSSDVNSCTFSEDDLCENELTKYTTAAYFVYVAIEDNFHTLGTFYYPLFLSKNDAIDANDIPTNTEVMSWTFEQHPGIIFWMPFSSKSKWGPGSNIHPPLAFEYIHFTNCIGSSGIYYHPISRNKRPRDAFKFQINNASVMNYMMESPVIITEQLDPLPPADTDIKIPWISLPDDEYNNWNKLFCITTNATNFNDLYSNSYDLKYYTDKDQWFNKNLLTIDSIDSNNHLLHPTKNVISIADDYINHICLNLFDNHCMWHLFSNVDDLLNDISNNNVNNDIKKKLEISDACGRTGLVESKVIPSTILSQLSHNSQFGHDRIKKLMAERNGDVSKKMCLLQEGDNIEFNITIEPSNNGIVDNMDEKRITKKIYKINFVLLHSDPKYNYDLTNLNLAFVTIVGRFFPSNILTLESPMFEDENKTGVFTFQWMRNGSNIQNETNRNYVLTDIDASKNISCKVIYTNTTDSSNSIITENYYINNTQLPVISGLLYTNFYLIANSYYIRGNLSYQWNRNGIPIDDARGKGYLLTQDDISSNISVTVSTDFPNIESVTSDETDIIKYSEEPSTPTNFKGIFSHTNKIMFSWNSNESYPFSYVIEKIYTVTVGDNLKTPGTSVDRITSQIPQFVELPSNTLLDIDIDIVQVIVDSTVHFSTPPAEDEKNTYIFPLDKDSWTNTSIRYVVFIQDSGFVKMIELIISKSIAINKTTLILGDLKYKDNPTPELLSFCPSGQALIFDQINRFSFTKWSSSALTTLHNEWYSAISTTSDDYALESVTLKIYEDIISTKHTNFPYELENYNFNYTIKSKNNNDMISERTNEISFISTSEKQLIDTWLSNNTGTLNRFGDPIDTVYTGGNPLFNEENELISDLYDYIKTQNPTNPWI